ncbi:MAG: hypothetical protein ACLPY5_00560 [Candidatus Bathyarchaeia archaeon]
MSQTDDLLRLGLSKLSELYDRRSQLEGTDQDTLIERRELDDKIAALQSTCNTTLLYSINKLLRSLKSESLKLRWLNAILIVLTAMLTILTALSVYKAFT